MTLITDCTALHAPAILSAIRRAERLSPAYWQIQRVILLYPNDRNMKSTNRKEKTLTFLYEYYRIIKHVYRSVRVRACEYAYH